MAWLQKKQSPPTGRQVASSERAQVFSYHTRRSQELGATGRQLFRDSFNTRTARRAGTYWLQRFGLLVFVIALCAGAVNLLLLSPNPRVLPADPSQAHFLHDTTVYKSASEQLLRSSLLNSNKLTVDTASVSAALKQQFPDLAEVSIRLPLIGHQPTIYLLPTKPALILSARFGKPYIVDEKGRVLGSAGRTTSASSANLVHVKDESGRVIRIGQLVLPSSTVTFVQDILFEVHARNMSVSTFVLPAGKSELDMYLDGQSYFVKFNLADPSPQQQVGTFFAVRQRLQGQGITPAHYVDVRVAGRAYYQ